MHALLDSVCDTSSFGVLPAALLAVYGASDDRSMLISTLVGVG